MERGRQALPEPDPESRTRRARAASRSACAGIDVHTAAPMPPAASVSRTAVISSKKRGSSRVSAVRGCSRSTSITSATRPGSGRHDDDARRKEDRLGDRVRDEHDCAAGLLPDAQELHVQPLAGHLVERAERLVHQEQRRVERQRPRDRDALLHAARELPRPVLDSNPCSSTSSSISANVHGGERGPSRASRAAGRRCGRQCASRRAPSPGRRSRSRDRAEPGARSCR